MFTYPKKPNNPDMIVHVAVFEDGVMIERYDTTAQALYEEQIAKLDNQKGPKNLQNNESISPPDQSPA